ncbi:MAG: hypothetical protein AAFZ18_02695 [Myxococcota bacterium]
MLLVTPGIATSAGHDKVMTLARRALGAEAPLQLARPEASWSSALGWGALDAGKLGLARLASARGPGALLTRAMEAGSLKARGSGGLSRTLTAPYRAELFARAAGGAREVLVSSHYLALSDRPPGWPAVLLGPDLLVQPAVSGIEAPRRALAPSRWYAEGLEACGFDPASIVSGLLVPEAVARAAELRRGGGGGDGVLLTIGGSAPEATAAVEVARAWSEAGAELTALVGDGRPHCRRLRKALEPSVHRVVGGGPADTRATELAAFVELLARPELGTWLTRPNEGAMLGLALGFEVVLLPPYQPHEKAAAERLRDLGLAEAGTRRPTGRPGTRPEMGRLLSEEEGKALISAP